MRGLLVAMLMACGGGSSDSPPLPAPLPVTPAGTDAVASLQPRAVAAPVAPSTSPAAPQRGRDDVAFDAAACRPGDGGSRSLSLGSQSIRVIGPDGDDCVFVHRREEEGAYRSERCRVPRGRGVIDLPKAASPSAVPGTCVVEKVGNVFADMKQMPAVNQVNLPDSHYVVTRYLAREGSGAVVRTGVPLPLTISLWGQDAPGLVAEVLDPRTALVARRTTAVVPGNATLGEALDAALLDTYRSPLRRGGDLRFLVREEAADELLAGLGVARSRIPAHAQLLVQVTVPGARPTNPGRQSR